MNLSERPLGVDPRGYLHDVTLTMLGTIVLVVLVIFLFLRRFVATVIPTLSLPVSLVGASRCCGAWAAAWTTSRCSASRWRWAWWSTTRS